MKMRKLFFAHFFLLALILCSCGKEESAQISQQIHEEIHQEIHQEIQEEIQDDTVPLANVPKASPEDKVESSFEVQFLDIGQGDASLIICDGEAALIDCGDINKGTKVRKYLRDAGISNLKYLILTHPDADHIGGAASVVTNVKIDDIYMTAFEKQNNVYKGLLDAMDYRYYTYEVPTPGQIAELGSATLEFLGPTKTYDNPNDASLVIKVTYFETSFLFGGDATMDAESDLVKSGADLDVDVYQVNHHGSSSSSSDAFLNALSPEYAVISCEKDNPYGHPHTEVLAALKERDIKVFRTDEQGSITVTSDKKELTWSTTPTAISTPAPTATPTPKPTATPTPKPTVAPTPTPTPEPTKEPEVAPAPVQSQPEAAPAPTVNYVANTNTYKFHHPSCSSVGKMKESNKWNTTNTRDELIAMGYVPCKNCNP